MKSRYLIIACLTSVIRSTWTPILNSTEHPLLNDALVDGQSETCSDLISVVGVDRLLLRGSLVVAYAQINVFLELRGGDIIFTYGTNKCNPRRSAVMSHVGPTSGSICAPYCGVPSLCVYMGIIETRDDIETHQFICHCGQSMCTEIILWIWPESLLDNPKLCEIRVLTWLSRRVIWEMVQLILSSNIFFYSLTMNIQVILPSSKLIKCFVIKVASKFHHLFCLRKYMFILPFVHRGKLRHHNTTNWISNKSSNVPDMAQWQCRCCFGCIS